MSKSLTFGHEDSLPPLPVPDLATTCKMYLHSLRPLVSDEEFSQNEAHMRKFLEAGGDGERLHAKLVEHASTCGGNWLERWWDDAAYLLSRFPNIVNTNYSAEIYGNGDIIPVVGPPPSLAQHTLVSESFIPQCFVIVMMKQYSYVFPVITVKA